MRSTTFDITMSPKFFAKFATLKVFRHVKDFVNAVGCDGVVIVVLVEKKKHKVNLTPIKSEQCPPKYYKLLSSPSSISFTMTASIESFSVGF